VSADIHQYAKKLEQNLARLRRSEKITEKDKQLIERFSTVLRTQRLTVGRAQKYVNHLTVLAKKLSDLTHQSGRGFDKAQKEDIELLNIWINEESGYTGNTKHDCIIVLKRYFQWLRAPPEEYQRWRKKHTYPPEVDDLVSSIKLNERFLPSDLLTESEVNSLIDACPWIMVMAVISLDDEVGARPGELLGMKIKDIIFDEGKRVVCRLGHQGGKTGERLILIIKSVSYVSRWLDAHPMKENPDAPLWIGFSNTNRHEPWSYHAFRKMLCDLAEKAKIRKKLSPYLFRHSAATRDARLGFTEAQLCMKYGWTLGSKMTRVYLHMANTDLYSKILEAYGGEEMEKPKPQTIKCSRCHFHNHTSQRFCSNCGEPLNPLDLSKMSIIYEEQKLQTKSEISELKETVTALEQRLLKMAGIQQ
jgi:integrase